MPPLTLTRREYKGRIYVKNISKNSCRIRNQLRSRIRIRKKSFTSTKLIRSLFFWKGQIQILSCWIQFNIDRNIFNLHMGWSILCSCLSSGFFSATIPRTCFGIDPVVSFTYPFYPSHFGSYPDHLVCTLPLTNGSGSGSCSFRHWPSRHQQKNIFFLKFYAYSFLNLHLHHSSNR